MALALPEAITVEIPTKHRLLLCGSTDGLGFVQDVLKAAGYTSVWASISHPISPHVRALLSSVDLVLLNVSLSNSDILSTIHELDAAIGICSVRPRLLCFSTSYRRPDFVLRIERSGARYLRVDGPAMLLEGIEILLAEMSELQRKGPCFQIVHRFSQGSCAPGEEVSAILLGHSGNYFQLPLALPQRLVFDFLAQRRIALDSLQIVSGLSGAWFYRDHAENSGQRQFKKIRRQTVKVLVQRIREAMSCSFAKAALRFDPSDVLRSCPAVGSKRVLYKLHADVQWHHPPG